MRALKRTRCYFGDQHYTGIILMLIFILFLHADGLEEISPDDIKVATDCPPTNSASYNVLAEKCTGNKKLHCARHAYTDTFTVKCLVPEKCSQGREPYIFDNSENVKCQFCKDDNSYNNVPSQWSYDFNSCTKKTELEPGMILCEHLQVTTAEKHKWNHYIRCDTTDNYILDEEVIDKPETEVQGYCTNATTARCIRYWCDSDDLELIKNYSCVPKCLASQKRDETTMECISKYETTLKPSTQQTTKTSTTGSPSTTMKEQKIIVTKQQNDGNRNEISSHIKVVFVIVGAILVALVTIGIICFCYLEKIIMCVKECRNKCQRNRRELPEDVHEAVPLTEIPQNTGETRTDSGMNDPQPGASGSSADEKDVSSRITYIEQVNIYHDHSAPTKSQPADNTAKTKDEEDNKFPNEEDIKFPHEESVPSPDPSPKGDIQATYLQTVHPEQEEAETSGQKQPRDSAIDVLSAGEVTSAGLQHLIQELSVVETRGRVELVRKYLESLYNESKFEELYQAASYLKENGYLHEFEKMLPDQLCVPRSDERSYKNIPDGFTAHHSSGQHNSCMYQSVSLQLTGDETLANLLRLLTAVHGVLHFNFFAKQIFAWLEKESRTTGKALSEVILVFYAQHLPPTFKRNDATTYSEEALNLECLKVLVMETPVLGEMSSQIQAMFLCGAIRRPIRQYLQIEMVNASFWKSLDPNGLCGDHTRDVEEEPIHIMWVNANNDPKTGPLNHVVPLWKKRGGVRPFDEPDVPLTFPEAIQVSYNTDTSEGSSEHGDPEPDVEQAVEKDETVQKVISVIPGHHNQSAESEV